MLLKARQKLPDYFLGRQKGMPIISSAAAGFYRLCPENL